MGSPASPAIPFGRLAGVGLVVFLANAALLVLQLVAGRLLAPFVGSSLETWTAVIGVFLLGIALGNAFGGRLADRFPSPRTLVALLAAGAVAALWMAAFPVMIASSGAYKAIPLGPRIPLLALALCLPAGFVLSLLTPLAIKLGLPDVSKTGRVTGLVFALGTLGCLLGNYVTGFVLIPMFTINTLVFTAAGALVALSIGSLVVLRETPGEPANVSPPELPISAPAVNPHAFADIRQAYAIVFLASFGGMALELTASRVLAEFLGVSLFTWTGIIGVMLAGTALGNFTGGVVADRVNRPGSRTNPRAALAVTVIAAGAGTVLLFVTKSVVAWLELFETRGQMTQVVCWSFSLFFLPMFALGMVSPQVIRLAVPDIAHVGRVAGRVYAWSTAGAIVGTFAAGYLLLSTIGMHRTVLGVSLVLTLVSLLVTRVWESNPMLYLFSLVLGGVTGGFILTGRASTRDADLIAQYESNYYTIKVAWERVRLLDAAGNPIGENGRYLRVRTGRWNMSLDALLHSSVDPNDPLFLHYRHEYIQAEFVRAARVANPAPKVLVIGGGGYTFPRYLKEIMPEAHVDVVEIDPLVTRAAVENFGLKPEYGIISHHMDGRQFVAEKAAPGTYDLIVQDAVNDLSVPSHLLTKEYNDAVKAALKPGGVYLLTVIDAVEYGQLWKAAMLTLHQTFPAENVALLAADAIDLTERQVFVISAADAPPDIPGLQAAVTAQVRDALRPGSTAAAALVGGTAAALFETYKPPLHTQLVPRDRIRPFLDAEPRIVLTDQFAPVDNLMADVYRKRYSKPKE